MDSNEIPPASFPPPPLSPPPVIMPPPAQPAPRRGRGWMIFALVALALLIVSVLANFTQWFAGFTPMRGMVHTRTAGPRLEEVVLEDHDASDKIAVVDVDGIITSSALDQSGATMVDLIKAQLQRAKEDRKVKAVILRVDSPGGEVLASDEIYRAILNFQTNSPDAKPVIASMGNLAASGGYYVSSPCRWIVANEMTITGSIGVIMHTWNYRGLMTKLGLKPEVYKSGKFKDMLSGERNPEEISPEERAMVQALIDETYSRFKTVVVEGRKYAREHNRQKGKGLVNNWQDYADGRILSGTTACELGFVDQVGNFQAAFEQALEIAGITGANLVKYQQRYDLADFFRIFGKSEAPVIKVDLGVETPKLEAGRLYFLSPTFLH